MKQMTELIKKLVNRETIAYLIAGILTTIINIIVYYVLCNILHIPNLIANAIAWIIAVIFAYIVNNRYVFTSEKVDAIGELMKVIKFFGARLFSFVIEEAGMFLFIDVLACNNIIVKIAMNIIVIILNYFLSKIYVFR